MRIEGSVIAKDRSGVWIAFRVDHCGTCRSDCHQRPANSIYLPMQLRNRVQLSVSFANLLRLLLNSLFFPLLGFIGGAIVADQLGFGELTTVVFSAIGMMTGMLMCSKLSLDKLNIKEV